MRLLLDLDCVLADFVAGACRTHGVDPADFYAAWPPGQYGMTEPLGRLLGREPFTDTDFWAPINRTRGFWSDLAPLPWYYTLWALVRSTTDDWWIVTAPSRCKECVYEKYEWIKHHLGTDAANRMEPVRNKHLMANGKTVLIDDCDANVEKFRAAGGYAITFPAHHNHEHALKNDPVPAVRRVLDLYRSLVCT